MRDLACGFVHGSSNSHFNECFLDDFGLCVFFYFFYQECLHNGPISFSRPASSSPEENCTDLAKRLIFDTVKFLSLILSEKAGFSRVYWAFFRSRLCVVGPPRTHWSWLKDHSASKVSRVSNVELNEICILIIVYTNKVSEECVM